MSHTRAPPPQAPLVGLEPQGCPFPPTAKRTTACGPSKLPSFIFLSLFFFLFLTEGIVGMCFAPAAVTRRCRSPASSSSNPAGSASPATAASTPVAPALTSNWTNPLLPLQTEAAPPPPRKEAGERRTFLADRSWAGQAARFGTGSPDS